MRIVYAKSTTSIGGPNGLTYQLIAGEAWNADDPVVVSHPGFFSELPLRVRSSSDGWLPVEQATAAPGEKRTVRR